MQFRSMVKDPRVGVKGRSKSRDISYNIEDILSLLHSHNLFFNESAIPIDPNDVARLEEIMCDTKGKIMKFHGVIHIKFMPDGIVVGRFDLDEEDE